MTVHKIIIGDSRDMKEVPDGAVHFIITSPPYWQLKDYNHANQIGFGDSYEDYINNLSLVWNECHRALHDGCRLCVVVGDQFARSAYYGRYKVIPIRTEIIKFCETLGFDYMGAVIWQKVTTCNTSGGATIMGSYPHPRNGILKIDYEFILNFKKPGKPPKVSPEIKEASRLSLEEWNEYFAGHWNFSGEKQDKHLATFPEELPRRLIKMFSFQGETILDPFLGSGTTAAAAARLGRNSVGYEINAEYRQTIEDRLSEAVSLAGNNHDVEVIEQRPENIDFNKKIEKLPYVFKDPVCFRRKVHPGALNFGSKVDGSEKEPETYHRVQKIVSPCEVVLDSGRKINLMGIKPNGRTDAQARQLLEKLTKGSKIYLRFDGNDNGTNCYLYLKNKTFVNAHLAKSSLVDVDTTQDYKFKQKFLKYKESAVA